MKVYGINLTSHFRLAKTVLLYFAIYILVVIFIKFQNFVDKIFFVKALSCIVLLLNFPAIFLHFCYYLKNKKVIVFEFEDSIEIHNHNSENIILTKENLKAIFVYMSASKIRFDITSGLPTEEYNYVKFETLDKEIVITNLIYPNIKQLASKFSDVKPQINNTIFAII